MDKKKQTQPRSKKAFFILVGMSAAILLAAPVLILLIVGFALDNFFHTAPTLMFVGAGIGFMSGIINIARLMKMMQNRKK